MSSRSSSASLNSANIYRPLKQKNNEFRLIDIQNDKDENAPVSCSLHYRSLSNEVRYCALSYVCGDKDECRVVMVDGKPLSVTAKCEEALKMLRTQDVGLVWVDQICINQEEDDERNAQILRIRSVYSEARMVLVWLGPAADNSDEIMKILKVATSAKSLYNSLSGLQDDALKVLRRPYWSRLWIIQEIAAATKIDVICGRERVEFEQVVTLYNAESDNKKLVNVPGRISDTRREEQALQVVRVLLDIRGYRSEARSLTLADLLYAGSLTQCSILLDKVFGLLGLASDGHQFISEPSYQTSEHNLCMNMIKSAFLRKRSLDMMLLGPLTNIERDDLGLPSWCPNFLKFPTRLNVDQMADYTAARNAHYRVGVSGNKWVTTNPSLTGREFFKTEDKRLIVHGKRIDTLVALGTHPITGERAESDQSIRTREELNQIGASFGRILLLYDKNYDRYLLSHSTVYQILRLADKGTEQMAAWWKMNKDFDCGGQTLEQITSVGFMVKSTFTKDNFKSAGKGIRGVFSKSEKPVKPKDQTKKSTSITAPFNSENIIPALDSLLEEKLRLALTQSSRTAWVIPDARLGDSIYLINGCTIPVVLRQTAVNSGVFSIIGHCYVDGVMDGKLWSGLTTDDLEAINII